MKKKLLLCPNAFKGTLDAMEAAQAMARGFQSSRLECECITLPIADGGDGSLRVVAGYLEADIETHEVRGPFGKEVTAAFGWNATTKTAVIELAEASGIRLLSKDELDPWTATTFGTGQLVAEVADRGAEVIYLTVGGSATVDGALGILDALGATCYAGDVPIKNPQPRDMGRISHIAVDEALKRLDKAEIRILCDVTNPLLGPEGAAAVFGPQKGASEAGVEELEKGFEVLVSVLKDLSGKDVSDLKHGGAAGGVPAVLHATLGAKLLPGAEQILDWAGFHKALDKADILITGEGKIDQQTGYGKGPGLVAQLAKKAGKPVIGLSGSVAPDDRTYEAFDAVFPITHAPVAFDEAVEMTAENLERTAFQLGNLWAVE